MAAKEPEVNVGNGIITLNCPLKPCKGETCRNFNCCEPRKDGRDIFKPEQKTVV